MAKAEQHWHLYLDESGDFLTGESPIACVAGWLVRDDAPSQLHAALHAGLSKATPIARHPLHSSHANLSPWWLASWQLAAESQRDAFAKLHVREAALLPVWMASLRARAGAGSPWRDFFAAIDQIGRAHV